MSEPVDPKGNEIATDIHRGMGITGTPVLDKVKCATGAESNVDVAKDVKANVESNNVGNTEPHEVDVGKPTSDSLVAGEKVESATTDLLCVGVSS